MKNRFDLESEISLTSIFSKHLRNLANDILEKQLTLDETANALEGLSILIEAHERVLFNTFTQVFGLDNSNIDDNIV